MSDGLRIYNQLAGAVQPFESSAEPVKIYVCGITPYDATHFGHAFTFVSFDVLIRYLKYLGHEVRYVQNVTDVDDPLFERARRLGVSYEDLALAETEQYAADMQALNVIPPDEFPRASAEIPGMIAMVRNLLQTGHAYRAGDTLYFSVASDPEYGKLSRYDRETMIELARERGGDPNDPKKRDPLDFVLWRPAREAEPALPGPWGSGLPGWHLECSTMALKYLGAPLDVHGGGADLIFPHHENEIAQSESVEGNKPFARFWMHTGMVFLGGEKMSKSLGNMVFVRDLVPEYGADAVRLYISRCHYRGELHYEPTEMANAAALADRLTSALAQPIRDEPATVDSSAYRKRFIDRMNDDLDTPGAIAAVRDLAEEIHAAGGPGENYSEAQKILRELGGVLGLRMAAQTHSLH